MRQIYFHEGWVIHYSSPALSISSEARDSIFKKALLSRFVDERFLTLFAEGKIFGTVHTCIGQELIGAVISEFLKKGDAVFSNHRGHGHFLSVTGDAAGLIAEVMGRESGVCGGWGGSQHLCAEGFYSNGIQGGMVPVAAGIALARKMAATDHLGVVFIGDGTLGEGTVYETMNMAAKWKVPLLIVLEDNGIAQSTKKETTFSGSIALRAEGFGFQFRQADTWSLDSFYATAGELISGIRKTSQPALLSVSTFRLKAHSKGDDTRSRDEVEPFERKDPLNVFLASPEAKEKHWIEDLRIEVGKSVIQAETAAFPSYSAPKLESKKIEWTAQSLEKKRGAKAINEAFRAGMAKDPSIIFIGEDVLSPYGGAFKVADGLSQLYPDQVFSTPISEAAIVGIGSGLALGGKRAFVEIMFGDFLGLAFDQLLNHAAKFKAMYHDKVALNVTVRTPMGGRRGYGPTHSQSIEKHFLGIPGLRVLALSNLIDPAEVYQKLFTENLGPTLVVENKSLYGLTLMSEVPAGFSLQKSNETIPSAWLKPESNAVDITLVGYGGMGGILVAAAEQLFVEYDIVAQVLCLSNLYPIPTASYGDILSAAPRMLFVEEGQGFAGMSGEFLSQLHELGLKDLKMRRLSAPEQIIPSASPLEKQMLPDVGHVIAYARGMMS